MSLTRRKFIGQSLVAGASMAVSLRGLQASGANDEVRVGVIGLGVRGTGAHIPQMERLDGVRVVAVCDPDRSRLDRCEAMIDKTFGHPVKKFVDVRKLIEQKDIDVVTVATMQYWHALPTIWACQAGKHVYCEKPLAHFIWEGEQMVKAARKYNRLVQIGTQHRSEQGVADAIQFVREGSLGKIKYITAFANKPRQSIGKRDTPLPIPSHVDYDLWCGPAQKELVYRDKLQYDCSFQWNTGDGESCNQGVHEIDVARWLLGEATMPRKVMSIGGRFVFDDVGDVPNTQIIYYDFPSAPVLYEVHNLHAAQGSNEVPTFRSARTGVCVQCEGGYVQLLSGRAFDNSEKQLPMAIKNPETVNPGGHFGNFISAVRSGRREDLNADILEGHRSTAVTHAGNISYRLGRKATHAEMHAAVEQVPHFNDMFDRFSEHLKAHGIDVNVPAATLGPCLEIDQDTERFRDNAAANLLVQGSYREPYVIPKL